MRYENWDVIVFPRDSHIPIQEFKTACYVSQDHYGRQLPTLSCYIASLPVSIPFRISIHLWSSTAKPSAVIESRRKPNQRVVYTAQVIVDGAQVFHDFYEVNSWPQEIVHEKRLVEYPEHICSQRKRALEFPPFHQNILMQSSWDARENNGRIKVLLSEQLISNRNSPGEFGFGAANDIVCFSFQHVPKDILEQAGISWPIRNPLYLPPASDGRYSTLQTPWLYTPSRNPLPGGQFQSMKQSGEPSFIRPCNPEPFARPKTDPAPLISHFRKPPVETRGRTRGTPWGDTLSMSTGNYVDDISMDTWSAKPTSTSTTDTSMPDVIFASPPSLGTRNSWQNPLKDLHVEQSKHWEENRPPTRDKDKHIVVTLREDQFGQLVEALSPPKHDRDHETNRRADQEYDNTTQASHQAYPPNMGPNIPINTRPSVTALARTASYHKRSLSSIKLSPTKPEDKKAANDAQISPGIYCGSFSSGKENLAPIPFPFDTRIPNPYSYTHALGRAHGQEPKVSNWDSDMPMRDSSSVLSSLSRFGTGPQQPNKSGHVPTPAASGNVRSRKEGTGARIPVPTSVPGDQRRRHHKSLLPTPKDAFARIPGTSHDNASASAAGVHTHLDAIPSVAESEMEPASFILGHRSGTESLDSIGRVEKQLFSALGEELNTCTSFGNHDLDDSHLQGHDRGCQHEGGEAVAALSEGLIEVGDSLAQKRKRQRPLSAERGGSPAAKVARDALGVRGDMGMDSQAQMPRLRGD